MSINDLPALSVLRTKMQWHQERQRVLSENVSNSDTPNFKPRDLVEPKFDNTGASATGSVGALPMARTSTDHISASGAEPTFDQNRRVGFRNQARRQCRQPGRRDAQGLRQPDGLRGGDLALQQEPASSEGSDWQSMIRTRKAVLATRELHHG